MANLYFIFGLVFLFFNKFARALEIINDDGYYESSDDIEVYKMVGNSFFDANRPEFYDDNLLGDMALAYNNQTVIISLNLSEYNSSYDCVRELLKIASASDEAGVARHRDAFYNQTISTEVNLEKRVSKICYLCSKPGRNCYQSQCRAGWGTAAAICILNFNTNRCNRAGSWANAACADCKCCSAF